jgi:hypothetical protein
MGPKREGACDVETDENWAVASQEILVSNTSRYGFEQDAQLTNTGAGSVPVPNERFGSLYGRTGLSAKSARDAICAVGTVGTFGAVGLGHMVRLGARITRGHDCDGLVAPIAELATLALHLGLVFLPPDGEAVKQAQRVLCGFVMWHLMLVLASLLREGADTLVHPLVAIHFCAFGRSKG